MCESSITYYHLFVTRFVKKQKKGKKSTLLFNIYRSPKSSRWPFDVGLRPSLCIVRCAWTFYIFLLPENTVTISCLKHLFDTRNLDCDVHGTTIPEGHMRGKICKTSRISKIFSTPTYVRKTLDAWLWCPWNPKLWKAWPMGQWFKL